MCLMYLNLSVSSVSRITGLKTDYKIKHSAYLYVYVYVIFYSKTFVLIC